MTSGIDATLYTVQRFFGRAATDETARRIGYPHTRFLDDRTWVLLTDNDTVALPNPFRVGRTKIGLLLYQGMGEIEFSSVTDTYPRALATDVLTFTYMAHRETRLIARNTARWIEYTVAHLELGDRDWQLGLVGRGIFPEPARLVQLRRNQADTRAAKAINDAASPTRASLTR